MALIAPVVTIAIDDPAVAGRIVRDYHHYGRDWSFEDDPDSHLEPKWWLGGCSYIRSMKAIAPMATVTFWDMQPLSWETWQIEHGENYWKRSRPAITKPRVQFYHYHRSSAGEYGSICSRRHLSPAQHFTFLRFRPVDGETNAPTIAARYSAIPAKFGPPHGIGVYCIIPSASRRTYIRSTASIHPAATRLRQLMPTSDHRHPTND